MAAYYNEIDPYAAKWLRNLIAAGYIAPGDVDERSIVDVCADDLAGYDQCHFFAGIGGWSHALRLAGWPDDRPVWTGSCPCQPFSAAGKGKAGDDERHLWPAWFSLIAKCNPPIVFGEQVEAAIGWGWLDVVFADLEGQGYACGASVLPACGVGAPHIRNRVWFVADAMQPAGERRTGSVSGAQAPLSGAGQPHGRVADRPSDGREAGRLLGHPDAARLAQRRGTVRVEGAAAGAAGVGGLADADEGQRGRLADGEGRERHGQAPGWQQGDGFTQSGGESFWSAADWLYCRDGKYRPVEPGTFPLAHGIPARVGKLRAYGNAIVPQVAAAFVSAFMECRP